MISLVSALLSFPSLCRPSVAWFLLADTSVQLRGLGFVYCLFIPRSDCRHGRTFILVTVVIIVFISLRLVLAAGGSLLLAWLDAAGRSAGCWVRLHWHLQRPLSDKGANHRHQTRELLS
jgi:hypothetical protein